MLLLPFLLSFAFAFPSILATSPSNIDSSSWICIQSSKKDLHRFTFVANVSGQVLCAGVDDRCFWFDQCPDSVPSDASPVLPCPTFATNDWCIIGGLHLGLASDCHCRLPDLSSDPSSDPPQTQPIDAPTPAPNTDTASPEPTGTVVNDPGPWREAFLTGYSSYPDPGSKECIDYNGCKWAGLFAYHAKMTEEQVKQTNILSVFVLAFGDAGPYKNKIFQVVDPDTSNTIVANVLDTCSDSDTPNNDCSNNAKRSKDGILIDMEFYTAQRFLARSFNKDFSDFPNKLVKFRCINC